MHKIGFALIFLAMMGVATAQTVTLNGLSSGGKTDNNTYVVLGQPFANHTTESGHEITAGLAQAQLIREEIPAEVPFGVGYHENGFDVAADTPMGDYVETKYTFADLHKYDKLTVLMLKIIMPAIVCDDFVSDIDGHDYPVLSLAGYCWTKTNMRAEHYSNDHGEIAKALIYNSSLHPDEADNLNTYGYLYTWYSAVHVPENSTETPSVNTAGYVQGICPNGWHIPTVSEMSALRLISAEDLRSTELWAIPNDNTNSTNFSELPAGRFNASSDRFEGMLTEAYLWSVATPVPDAASALAFSYYCDTPQLNHLSANDAVSVRCVKDY